MCAYGRHKIRVCENLIDDCIPDTFAILWLRYVVWYNFSADAQMVYIYSYPQIEWQAVCAQRNKNRHQIVGIQKGG